METKSSEVQLRRSKRIPVPSNTYSSKDFQDPTQMNRRDSKQKNTQGQVKLEEISNYDSNPFRSQKLEKSDSQQLAQDQDDQDSSDNSKQTYQTRKNRKKTKFADETYEKQQVQPKLKKKMEKIKIKSGASRQSKQEVTEKVKKPKTPKTKVKGEKLKNQNGSKKSDSISEQHNENSHQNDESEESSMRAELASKQEMSSRNETSVKQEPSVKQEVPIKQEASTSVQIQETVPTPLQIPARQNTSEKPAFNILSLLYKAAQCVATESLNNEDKKVNETQSGAQQEKPKKQYNKTKKTPQEPGLKKKQKLNAQTSQADTNPGQQASNLVLSQQNLSLNTSQQIPPPSNNLLPSNSQSNIQLENLDRPVNTTIEERMIEEAQEDKGQNQYHIEKVTKQEKRIILHHSHLDAIELDENLNPMMSENERIRAQNNDLQKDLKVEQLSDSQIFRNLENTNSSFQQKYQDLKEKFNEAKKTCKPNIFC